ncbi:MAG: potassium transporter Kup, partial [Mycobacterium sp.]|nr:potassium transporter Kup [Mycobacterium sp.]
EELVPTDSRILFAKASFGYMEDPDVPAVLRLIDSSVDRGDISSFLSRVAVVPGPAPTMARWRQRLFVATSHLAADSASYFSLPLDRTAIVGARIEL